MEIIARVPDATLARSLIVALRAYGFHPEDDMDGGLPGVTRVMEWAEAAVASLR